MAKKYEFVNEQEEIKYLRDTMDELVDNLDAFVVALDNQEANILNYSSMSFDKRLDLAIDECYTSKNADKARD